VSALFNTGMDIYLLVGLPFCMYAVTKVNSAWPSIHG